MRDGRDHWYAQAFGKRLDVDEQPLLARFVDAVQGDHQRSPEEAELKREFEVLFERRRVDHLNQHIGRCQAGAFLTLFVLGDERPVVAPQQVHQYRLVVFAELMQRVDRRQVNQRDLVEPDVDHAFLIGAADAGQSLVANDRACRSVEQGALADAVTADQRHAWAPFAAQQRPA